MSGPSVINTKGTYTWTANASGGVGGYTYQWSVTYDAGPHYTLGTASSQQLTVYGDDGNSEIVTHCHHGVRSMKALEILRAAGFAQVRSLKGGIDAWSVTVDPSVPRY